MSEPTLEKFAHDLLVEKVQKILSKQSNLLYDLKYSETELEIAYKNIREFEAKYNLPKRM